MKIKQRCFARQGNGSLEKKRKWERKTKTLSEQSGWRMEGKLKRRQAEESVMVRSEDEAALSRMTNLSPRRKVKGIEQKALAYGRSEQWLVWFQYLLLPNFFHFLPTLTVCVLLCICFLSKLSFGKFKFPLPRVTLTLTFPTEHIRWFIYAFANKNIALVKNVKSVVWIPVFWNRLFIL